VPDTAQLKRQLKRSMHALMLVLVARKRQELAGIVSWPDIADKPDAYPPEQHEHQSYMDRQHAYALLAQIERNLREDLAEISARFADALTHEHQETSATFAALRADLAGLTWADIPGKPASYPPEPHTHSQYAPLQHTHRLADLAGLQHADQLVALARVLQAGKPGQFLQKTKSGYAWAWPDTIIYQQPVSGGMAHIPAPGPTILDAILISDTDGPILVDDTGAYLQYQ
jgi:hypothetical protein